MRTATLYRVRPFGPAVPTMGLLVIADAGRTLATVCTLELPWQDNARGASCIPAGTYVARYTRSPKFGTRLLELFGVPGRSAIRVHAANHTSELQGCIAPCTYHTQINADGIIDGAASRSALQRLSELMPDNGQEYRFTVVNPTP